MRNETIQEFEEFEHSNDSRMYMNWLFSMMEKIPFASLFTMLPAHTGTVVYDITICTACHSVIGALLAYSQTHSQQELRNLAYAICTNLGIQTDEVCAGVIDLNMVTEPHL
jgi:uncharacterized protein YcgI (DUF1989 family)